MRLIDILLGLGTLALLSGVWNIFTYITRKRGYETLKKDNQSFFDFLYEYYEWAEWKQRFRIIYNSKLYLIFTRLIVIAQFLFFIIVVSGCIWCYFSDYKDLLFYKF